MAFHDQHKLLIVSPVRNEQKFIQQTIDSIVAQTHRPARWIIVDDGSTDATAEIAEQAAQRHSWITVHRRADRGERCVGGGVVEAFEEGRRLVDLDAFDFICKLDGDLRIGPTYFQELFRRFDGNPRLGTASGKCWLATDRGLVQERIGDEFSLGACKCYRRECFQAIGGFIREVHWDGIDCHRCRMLGWQARSFHDESLRIIHLRQMGSSFRNIYHGRLRWGYGQYYMGTHPLYALAIATYRTLERPWLVGGVLILTGYLNGYLRHLPRYEDPQFRRYLRCWQLRRLHLTRHLPSNGNPRPVATSCHV